MIDVSERSAKALRYALTKKGVSPQKGLRLFRIGDEWSFFVEEPREGDRVVRSPDGVALIIASDADRRWGNLALEVEERAGDQELVLLQRTAASRYT